MELEQGLRTHPEHAAFQVNVAERWLKTARDMQGRSDRTPEFEFVAGFSAFNSLYWLWGEATGAEAFTDDERRLIEQAITQIPEKLRRRVCDRVLGLAGEPKLIDGLVGSLGSAVAKSILSDTEVEAKVTYLIERDPLQRMDRRKPNGVTGNPSEGRRHRERLAKVELEPVERLQALTQILYIVRCNLVHGSKMVEGYDLELLGHCVPPLLAIAQACLTKIREARG